MTGYKREAQFFDKNLNGVTVKVKVNKEGIFSVCGDYDGGCGQIYDNINPLDIYQERLIKLWKKYHLISPTTNIFFYD